MSKRKIINGYYLYKKQEPGRWVVSIKRRGMPSIKFDHSKENVAMNNAINYCLANPATKSGRSAYCIGNNTHSGMSFTKYELEILLITTPKQYTQLYGKLEKYYQSITKG